MSPEPDFLKPSAYEVSAENFLRDLSIIQIRLPDLEIFAGDITKGGIDTFYRWAKETEGTEMSELFLNESRSAEIESATMTAVAVIILGKRKRIEAVEQEIDELVLKHEGARNDREFNTTHNRVMDKVDIGKPDTAKILVYEFLSHQA